MSNPTASRGWIARLSQLLKVPADEVEAVLKHDDARARATVRLQRRGFLGAAAAMAAAPFVPKVFMQASFHLPTWWYWETSWSYGGNLITLKVSEHCHRFETAAALP